MTAQDVVSEEFADRRRPRVGISFRRSAEIALRELRSGLKGFYIFIACIALGVAVITTVGSLSDAIRAGIGSQGVTLLGGDVTLARIHQRASDTERAWIEAQGRVSEVATLRAMARQAQGDEQALIEIKAVDAAYPLAGAVPIIEGEAFRAAIDPSGTVAVDPSLLKRLNARIGDTIRIGEASVTIRATIGDEPDAVADRLTYGPRVFMSLATLDTTGLVKPGTLVKWRYAVLLSGADAQTNEGLSDFKAKAKLAVGDDGFSIGDRNNPSPQVSKTIDRLRQFLIFLGLASLLVGGVGVASAVATFIERRRMVIATLKSLGAPSHIVLRMFLIQVLAIAAIGVVVGLVVGLIVPVALTHAYGDLMPVKAEISYSARTILTGIAYGLLVSLLFTLWPLGRAELIRPSVLFRDEASEAPEWPRRGILVATALTGLALLGFAVLMAESQKIALMFCGGLALVLAIFAGLGAGLQWVARRVPKPKRPEFALAIGNIGAPRGLARSIVVSLGAGLSLLVAVALVNASLIAELSSRIPKMAPNYFVLDIAKGDYDAFRDLVMATQAEASVVAAPMLRGRLVAVKGVSTDGLKVAPEAQWVLNGDRGLTYADEVPAGSTLVKGEWWQPGYEGEPLVSFESELARHLGVDIGDEVTVSVLGRNLTARIANLREVKWESLNLNFVMVFSPNALKAAPHTILATVTLPKTVSLDADVGLAKVIGKSFPSLTVVRVTEAIESFKEIFEKVMVAVRAAGAVTLLSGALVLAGALATAQRRRIIEAVLLKVLGATRRRILTIHVIEYLILSAAAAVFAVALGAASAWAVVHFGMHIPFTFTSLAVAQALGLAATLVLAFGLLGTYSVLKARPVPYLRQG